MSVRVCFLICEEITLWASRQGVCKQCASRGVSPPLYAHADRHAQTHTHTQVLPPDKDVLLRGIHGTLSHMPPEAMRSTQFSAATDVYSFGIVSLVDSIWSIMYSFGLVLWSRRRTVL